MDIVDSIDGLAALSSLLARPENHIQVKTKQRGERVPPRTIADMTNEMEGELTELPKYTAYAKVLQGQNIWRGKIKTRGLAMPASHGISYLSIPIPDSLLEYFSKCKTRTERITDNTLKYCRKRTEIEEEMKKRQGSWKPKQETRYEKKPPDKPKSGGVTKDHFKTGNIPHSPDEPPPTRY